MTFYLCTTDGHLPGGEKFTFGIHVSGVAGAADDVLTAWTAQLAVLFNHDAGLGNTLKSHISDQVGTDDAQVAELDDSTGFQVTKVMGTATNTGTNVGDPLPPQVSLAVSLRTSLATKAGRGRFYLPPLAVGASLAGELILAAQEAAVAGAQTALTGMATAGFPCVVYHRSDQTGTMVNRIDVGNVFDTQRRRRNKLVETRLSATI
jgi:hypothetical protein